MEGKETLHKLLLIIHFSAAEPSVFHASLFLRIENMNDLVCFQ